MFTDPSGPIEHFAWATFVIDGQTHAWDDAQERQIGAGKDIRLIGCTVTAWEERHGHTLTPEMITGVYGQGAETLIIGIGVHGLIQVNTEVQQAIRQEGIAEIILERTPAACATYNRLYRAGRKVALLAHGTC
jgi:hypothetical protein